MQYCYSLTSGHEDKIPLFLTHLQILFNHETNKEKQGLKCKRTKQKFKISK